jgi:hypothetical protein
MGSPWDVGVGECVGVSIDMHPWCNTLWYAWVHIGTERRTAVHYMGTVRSAKDLLELAQKHMILLKKCGTEEPGAD